MKSNIDPFRLKSFLEGLYFVYNRRELVYPDPLVFLYDYESPEDREIVGLVSSSLAYGRVAQILKSVSRVLEPMGSRPRDFLFDNAERLHALFADFKHRFTTGRQMADLLVRVAEVVGEYGSLESFMGNCLRKAGELFPALDLFSSRLSPENCSFPLLSSPAGGSACKRLALYLKWMVRCDEVDPGGWKALAPGDLLMPTDTHIHNIALQLGLTSRRQADLKAAAEITEAFARLTPEDPTRYDFVLTRFGIRGGLNISDMVELYEK